MSSSYRKQPPPIPYATKPARSGPLPLPPKKDNSVMTGSQSSYNPFDVPIDTRAPKFDSRSHLLQPLSTAPCSQLKTPIHTQKFYANLLLGSQRSQIYPLPYIIKWSGRGLDINHTDDNQRVFGPDLAALQAQYYFCPVGIVSLSLAAREDLAVLQTENHDQFSVDVILRSQVCSGNMTTSIVRGSAFITSRYQDLTPRISSEVMFRSISEAHLSASIQKWRVLLEDGKLWLVYASGQTSLHLEQTSNQEFLGSMKWNGIIQVAKMPVGDAAVERLFDAAAGTYPTTMKLSGQVKDQAEYAFRMISNNSQPSLMYALPHHVESFMDDMSNKVYANTLESQTNGTMSLVWATEWHMTEVLPSPNNLIACPQPRPESKNLIDSVLMTDVKQDIESQIRGDSMYFCGKALNKLAQITILASQLCSSTSSELLSRLENNLMVFVRNRQQYPLIYEHTWGGLVSTQGFTERGDGADFGNTWYNDHHYHYGYHISSAAIYLKLKPNSDFRLEIESWVKTLIRDVASPMSDAWFCAYRSMDWFVGHSWSKGLYESADGKDEESSSEDYHFTYAMHLFAEVTGDRAMLDRAKIQMAVQRHAINMYMLFSPDNKVVPSRLLPNCVSGIKFENKIDYTTYFGTNQEFIHGIHILPITPVTSFFRLESFVHNEWQSKLQSLVTKTGGNMQPGWRGLLYASIGLCEGEGGAAWEYFKKDEACDDGVCRSWLLAMISFMT